MMRRIPDVLTAGSSPARCPCPGALLPLRERRWSESHYPLIVEYIGQTRGWFYTSRPGATALFDWPAHLSCVPTASSWATTGPRYKSPRNYPDVSMVFDGTGRRHALFLLGAGYARGNLVVTDKAIHRAPGCSRRCGTPGTSSLLRGVRWASPTQDTDGVDLGDASLFAKHGGLHVMDRYVLARTGRPGRETVAAQMDGYDITGACATIRDFPRTYHQLVPAHPRQRFTDGETAAFDTWPPRACSSRDDARLLAPLVSE